MLLAAPATIFSFVRHAVCRSVVRLEAGFAFLLFRRLLCFNGLRHIQKPSTKPFQAVLLLSFLFFLLASKGEIHVAGTSDALLLFVASCLRSPYESQRQTDAFNCFSSPHFLYLNRCISTSLRIPASRPFCYRSASPCFIPNSPSHSTRSSNRTV